MSDRCPGALHAVPARDGLLVRVRIPGGLISCAQWTVLAQLARRCGDGRIDITARANVQLRGLRAEALPELTEALEAGGLLPSPSHERVRNILASPFAGIDAEEILDMRPLVRALDACLCADPALADLPAKFCFALDGVGEYQLDTTYADLALRAVAPDASRSVRVRLIVGGEICGEEMPAEQGVEALLDAARAAEGKRLFTRGCSSSDASSSPLAPLGVSEAHRPDLLNLAPSIPLGRVNAEQAFGVAALVRGYGGELRLAPWRGLVLGAMPRAELAEIVEELQGLGLPLDASDGYRGIAACVGIEGCAEALADVRRDAATLARRLAARAQGTACAISLAACPKRCGMRRGVGIEFVARREGYDVFVDGKLALAEISSLRLPQELVDRELSAHDLGDAFEFRLMELQQSKA